MSLAGSLYRGDTNFDFMKYRKRWFTLSAVLIAISFLSLGVRGLDLSVDFTGGTIVEADNTNDATLGEVRSALAVVGEEGARVQITSGGTIRVQTVSLEPAEQDALVVAVADVAGVSFDETNVDAVGPTFGAEITRAAIEALVVFLLVVMAFITWRLEWKMAIAAIAALFHDLIITAGLYSIIGFEVTPATVIAILTILGYSLYDTVVVFDKIVENENEFGNEFTYTEIANLSMNQVLMRSINTSATSLLPIGSLLFVGSYLLGAATLRQFALALFVGVTIGTYSSIFVATPLLVMWKEREPHWQRMQRRVARRTGEKEAPDTVGAVLEVAPEVRDSGATPQAPKKRRKRR
jgi:preprotein translocase subunit SecF